MQKSGNSPLLRYDDLTGLPTRILFNEILLKSISHAKRRNLKLALLLIEISAAEASCNQDQKIWNTLLQLAGERLVNTLRSEDILAKAEDCEFLILLSDIGKAKFASTVAEKIVAAFQKPFNVEGREITLRISIGISIYPEDGDSLETLITNLDATLYKAKNLEGSHYQFFTTTMDAEAREYIQMESALRRTLINKELTLYFQPMLRIGQGKITNVEALVRWMHPQLGIIGPDKFIPIAEENGFIIQLGEWVLNEACAINKLWQDEGYEQITISVNLSPKQFYHPNLVNMISKALEKSKLSPHFLEIEINEKTIMHDIEFTTTILEKIKATGVKISIDHFGAGYTSISHLKIFPISTVKIDPYFVKGTPFNPNDMAISTALITLAHSLGLEVVAEGVETAEQVEFLSAQHCDFIQGYFLSRPVPADKMVAQLKKLIDVIF